MGLKSPEGDSRSISASAGTDIANPVEKNHSEGILTQGNLWKAIWIMSWPLTIQTVATSLVGIVDVQVSGWLGRSAQAAVGVSEHIIFMFMIFLLSIGAGATAIVSREFGEGKVEAAHKSIGQSLGLSCLTGVVLAFIAVLLSHSFLPLFTNPQDYELRGLGITYLSIYGLYMIPFSFTCVASAAFRAAGDARVPLLVAAVQVVVNIVGDYATVLGNWPVPGLGIRGIAWSGVIASITGACVIIWRMSASPLGPSLKHMFPVSFPEWQRILHVGVPTALHRLGWACSVFAIFYILSCVPESSAAQAAWTIGIRVESFLFMPLMALGLAVASIIGQNLGAGQIDRAESAGWRVTWIGVALMLVSATVLFILAPQLAMFLSRDAATVKYATDYLRINAIAEPFLAVNMILSGALQGAGDTRAPMWISFFSSWVVRLPLSYCAALLLGFGPSGVWWAMTASIVCSCVLITWRFRSGRWKEIRV